MTIDPAEFPTRRSIREAKAASQNARRGGTSKLRGQGAAPLVSVTSQAVGSLQLVLLVWRAGTTSYTDTYFYSFTMGMLPIQIVVVGLLYPLLLNQHRATRQLAHWIGRMTPGLSLIMVASGALWLVHNHRPVSVVLTVALPSMANALVQARVWFLAVAAEAGGDPLWISGVAIPANVLAVVFLAAPWPSDVAVTVMVYALVIGNLGLWAAMARRGVGSAVLSELPIVSKGSLKASGWFASKAAVGYGGLAVLQSLAVLLPVSGITVLNIAVKIVGSVVATTVNAVMPRLVHQQSTSVRPGMRFLSWLSLAVVALTAVATMLAGLIEGQRAAATVLAVGLWIVGSSASAVSQRSSYRFLRASASRVSLVVVPVVVVAALLSSRFHGFSLLGLLCAYAAVDGFTGALLLGVLKQRLLCAVVFGLMAVECVLWTLSFH